MHTTELAVSEVLEELRQHRNINELASFSKVTLENVLKIVSSVPDNACVRLENPFFESYCHFININGSWFLYDMTRLPTSDALIAWDWVKDIDTNIEYLKEEELPVEQNCSPDCTLEDLMCYKSLNNDWTVIVDKDYTSSIGESFSAMRNPEDYDMHEVFEVSVYPNSDAEPVDILAIAQLIYSK